MAIHHQTKQTGSVLWIIRGLLLVFTRAANY